MDVTTTLFGTTLKTPIYNASGVWCTTSEELKQVYDSEWSGAVVTKSCTLNSREGNPEPRYSHSIREVSNASINSMGIPNHGIDYYIQASKDIATNEKPFTVSVSGLSISENIEILKRLSSGDNASCVSAVELNLSCPNVPGKPQLAYDFEAFEDTLSKVFELDLDLNIGLKLPPYFDMSHFGQAADVIKTAGSKVSFIVCCNSLGNGLLVDWKTESTLIRPKEGHGGVGGDFIKPIALSNVRRFYKLLDDKVDVIGCGGVKSGLDVFEHVLCGAKAVQIGTTLYKESTVCFERIMKEFSSMCLEKDYTSLESFRGKLKIV